MSLVVSAKTATCDPALEQTRCGLERSSDDRAVRRLTRATALTALCERAHLRWHHVSWHVQQRVCRTCDILDGGRTLAAALNVHPLDTEWYSRQTAGELRGPSELMLADWRSRHGSARLQVSLMLALLIQQEQWRCLADIERPVYEECRRRLGLQQQEASRLSSSSISGLSSTSCSEDRSQDNDGDGDGRSSCDSGVDSGRLSSRDALDERRPVNQSVPTAAARRSPVVMLTYAADGRDAALKVADVLKNGSGGGGDVGRASCRVLLLEKQRRHMMVDYHAAVMRWFEQVDYVVAVLTPDYLAATQNGAQEHWSDGDQEKQYGDDVDSGVVAQEQETFQGRATRTEAEERQHRRWLARDVRLLYTLMCGRLERHNYENWWFRALVPDACVAQVRLHPLYGSPVFRFPVSMSCVEELAECMTV